MTVILSGSSPVVTPPTGPGVPYVPPPPPSYGEILLRSSRGSVRLTGAAEALEGWEGFGPPRRSVNYSSPLGRDGWIRNRMRPCLVGGREIVGPIHVQAPTARARAELMDRIIDVCTPLDGTEVTFSINRYGVAYTTSGDVTFEGGAEFSARAAYDRVAIVQFAMTCPDGHFYAAETSQTQRQVEGAAFFPIAPLILADSTSFGDELEVVTGGTMPTYARVELSGPATSFTYAPVGRRPFELDLTDVPLLAGEKIVVRTDPASGLAGQYRVEGPAGESYWRYLTQRAFVPLQPGSDRIVLDVPGAGNGTEVRVFWRPAVQAVS